MPRPNLWYFTIIVPCRVPLHKGCRVCAVVDRHLHVLIFTTVADIEAWTEERLRKCWQTYLHVNELTSLTSCYKKGHIVTAGIPASATSRADREPNSSQGKYQLLFTERLVLPLNLLSFLQWKKSTHLNFNHLIFSLCWYVCRHHSLTYQKKFTLNITLKCNCPGKHPACCLLTKVRFTRKVSLCLISLHFLKKIHTRYTWVYRQAFYMLHSGRFTNYINPSSFLKLFLYLNCLRLFFCFYCTSFQSCTPVSGDSAL